MKTLLLVFLLPFAHAKDVAITEYFRSPVNPRDRVCEPPVSNGAPARCFLVVDAERTLTPQDDPSGRLQLNPVSPKQGPFDRVRVGQMLSALAPEKLGREATVDVFVKVMWNGHLPSQFKFHAQDTPTEGMTVVKGRLRLAAQGEYFFELQGLPNMGFAGLFFPDFNTASQFGRNSATEAKELEADVRLFMHDVVSSVIKDLVTSGAIAPKN